mmetsp:Transcript_70989/g.211668  ORF Transcript_70989/g.211668 Transcript_70989/m.211668 type:complete len:302 (-) Transcript_70989:1484-2389(-)
MPLARTATTTARRPCSATPCRSPCLARRRRRRAARTLTAWRPCSLRPRVLWQEPSTADRHPQIRQMKPPWCSPQSQRMTSSPSGAATAAWSPGSQRDGPKMGSPCSSGNVQPGGPKPTRVLGCSPWQSTRRQPARRSLRHRPRPMTWQCPRAAARRTTRLQPRPHLRFLASRQLTCARCWSRGLCHPCSFSSWGPFPPRAAAHAAPRPAARHRRRRPPSTSGHRLRRLRRPRGSRPWRPATPPQPCGAWPQSCGPWRRWRRRRRSCISYRTLASWPRAAQGWPRTTARILQASAVSVCRAG